MSDRTALKNQYYNWIMKIQFSLLENDLFQPIGLELSCVEIILETDDDYSFSDIKNSDIEKKYFPLAYYRPDTDSIHIYIEHESFKNRESDSEKMAFLMFLLFHEANHRLLMHIKRGKEKDHDLYNIASDMEIHNMFYVYNELMQANSKYSSSLIYQMTKNYIVDFLFNKNDKKKDEGLFEIDFLQNTAEEIYAILQNSKEIQEKEFVLNIDRQNESQDEKQSNGKGMTVKVRNITYKMPSGKKITSTIVEMPEINNNKESEEDEKNKEAGQITRKTLMENNLQSQMDKLSNDESNNYRRGTISNACKIFLKKLFHVKVDWKKILRNSLQTALEKSEYFSWAQPRTSLFGLQQNVFLPGQIDDECAYGTVIIARDESGSMSDAECEKAAGIIADSKEYYKKIIVIKHDVKITSINEIDDLDDDAKKMLLKRNSIGGTSHKEVFEFIKNYSINNKEKEKISCCIFITDMESDIEEYQKIIPTDVPKIWLTTPSSAENFKNLVKGKIIPIEL